MTLSKTSAILGMTLAGVLILPTVSLATHSTSFSSPNGETVSAQSKIDKDENVAQKAEVDNESSEGNATPAATTTTTNSNSVPTSVSQVAEYGEDIYDAAKANNWTESTAKLNSLKNAAKRIDNESKISENPSEDKLDGAIAALDKAVPAHQQLATMRDANQVTLLAANLSVPFNPPVPVQVPLLDYYGRQLEIGAVANDMTQLQATAKDMSRTWNAVRSAVESHGGSAQAQQFDNLVARVQAAKSSKEYGSLATSVLNQVDNLEKVLAK